MLSPHSNLFCLLQHGCSPLQHEWHECIHVSISINCVVFVIWTWDTSALCCGFAPFVSVYQTKLISFEWMDAEPDIITIESYYDACSLPTCCDVRSNPGAFQSIILIMILKLWHSTHLRAWSGAGMWEHQVRKVWKKSEIICNAWKGVFFNAFKVSKGGLWRAKKVWNQRNIWPLMDSYRPKIPVKWGIKVFTLCKSETDYTVNLKIYTGKRATCNNLRLGGVFFWHNDNNTSHAQFMFRYSQKHIHNV